MYIYTAVCFPQSLLKPVTSYEETSFFGVKYSNVFSGLQLTSEPNMSRVALFENHMTFVMCKLKLG